MKYDLEDFEIQITGQAMHIITQMTRNPQLSGLIWKTMRDDVIDEAIKIQSQLDYSINDTQLAAIIGTAMLNAVSCYYFEGFPSMETMQDGAFDKYIIEDDHVTDDDYAKQVHIRKSRGYDRVRSDEKKKRRTIERCESLNTWRGPWVEDGRNGKYIKQPSHSRRQRFLKKQSNKVVRRNGKAMQGNQYRRCFDYQWELD